MQPKLSRGILVVRHLSVIKYLSALGCGITIRMVPILFQPGWTQLRYLSDLKKVGSLFIFKGSPSSKENTLLWRVLPFLLSAGRRSP